MKKIIILTTVVALAFLNSCKREQKAIQIPSKSNIKIEELNYNPGSTEEMKAQVLNFLNHTKYGNSKTTSTFPDRPIYEGAYLLEGAANYLRNVNFGHTLEVMQTIDKDIAKIDANTLSGASMVAQFEQLLTEIEGYEIGGTNEAYLINGYIISQDNQAATVRFDVYLGDEPLWGNDVVYPNTDADYCTAAENLESYVNWDLQLNNVFVAGVVTHAQVGIAPGATAFYNTNRLWYSPGNSTFLASQYPQFHIGGIECAEHFASTLTPANPNPNVGQVNPKAIFVDMQCDVAFDPLTTIYFHRIVDVTTAMHLANY